MGKSSHVPLSDLLGSFALSAIEVQQLWNQASQPASQALFAPARLVLKQWQADWKISLAATRENGFVLQARILNLRFERTYQETRSTASSVSFQIEQVPAEETKNGG